ncbi:YgaP family membrane protein [Hyphococcus sp.]|uniref:YgaP family membrane protein n=1 Tax=Hyphococcus sp. TaxID=2038636 RepID=UPI0035C681D1
MNIDRTVFAFAGFVTLLGLVLGLFVHPYWFALNAFVGLNMFQAAFTGFCPLAMILKRLGLQPGAAFA